MKTLLLISHSSSLTGGGEDDFQKLLMFLYGKYKIYTIFPKGPRSETFKKYSDYHLEIKGNVFPFTKFSIRNYLGFLKVNFRKPFQIYFFLKKNRGIDLCFVNSSVCLLEVIPLVLMKIPYILSVKEKIKPEIIRRIFFFIYKKTAVKILTISKFLRDEIVKVSARNDIEILYSTINESDFDKKINEYRTGYKDENKNKFKVINIGSIQPLKGQHILLGSMTMLRDLDISLEYIGCVVDEKYFSFMQKYLVENKLENKVIFTGELSKSEVIKKILGSNCVVITSSEEGQSLVILESLYLEKPLITTKVGVALEIIENNLNGLFYDYGDAANLSVLLKKLLIDKNLYKIIESNCKITYLKNFNADSVLMKYEKIITDCLITV